MRRFALVALLTLAACGPAQPLLTGRYAGQVAPQKLADSFYAGIPSCKPLLASGALVRVAFSEAGKPLAGEFAPTGGNSWGTVASSASSFVLPENGLGEVDFEYDWSAKFRLQLASVDNWQSLVGSLTVTQEHCQEDTGSFSMVHE